MLQKKVFDVGIFDDMIFDAEELGIPNELEEGVYDKGIFKAVILVGGPGSGKSAFSQQANLSAKGFRPVVSDDIFEYVRLKQGKSLDLDSENYGADRDYAKPIARRRELNYLEGRLPIFYETSLSNVGKAKNEVRIVRRMGYEVFVIYVKTAPKLALSRNNNRSRKLPQKWVKDRLINILKIFYNTVKYSRAVRVWVLIVSIL